MKNGSSAMANHQQLTPLFNGSTPLDCSEHLVSGDYIQLDGEQFYRIQNYDSMEPFFMSLVSSSNHWLFISSTGGISAGRINAEHALFPYYTVDKITENSANTGNKVILLVTRPAGRYLWEPFSELQSGLYRLQRNLYKNISGSTLIFEEVNFDLNLTYRYAWRFSDRYGFVKTTWLVNASPSNCTLELVDGLQNLLPANVSSQTQIVLSNLLDAYKRNELDPDTGLGIFALSSNMTDLAEPSEALVATTVAQVGLQPENYLLSTRQLEQFRRGKAITSEWEVRGQRSAYLVHFSLDLKPGERKTWHLVADVYQDHVAIVALRKELLSDARILYQSIETDIAQNQTNLWKVVARADGLQETQSRTSTTHHFANVLFNIMRGGIFAEGYQVSTSDLRDFIALHNQRLLDEQAAFFAQIPARLLVNELHQLAEATGSPDLLRLCSAYLPLTFSRRHGDPSRPWNRFTINVKKPDGSQRLDFEGNWRDIFQNWEALAWAYPEFVESMLGTFLNATTVDGYNPYRITRHGVDWELPDPHNPWANIGYWSDHQLIYLQKLLEISASVHPGRLQQMLARPAYSYANVPYRLKPYESLLQDPYNTIEFSWELQRQIEQQEPLLGADARLVPQPDGGVWHANLAEKLLTLILAKLANFVPEGGIWMNTQRPEWNDANNALVGKGLSVVTLCYLRRFLVFSQELFTTSSFETLPIQEELVAFFNQVTGIMLRFQPFLSDRFDDEQRKAVMDALGQAGSDYRWQFYREGVSGTLASLPTRQIVKFCELALAYIDHSLRANHRSDHLFHAYNILHLGDRRAIISHLADMLEGQVAILSSGLLSSEEALALLNSLRSGPLYRADQHSYILYPDRELPAFLDKNHIPPERVRALPLVQALIEAQDNSLFSRDMQGNYHFCGHIRNIKDVNKALAALQDQARFTRLVEADGVKIRELFEEVFHHDQFTGRSSTFFAYEGLGSIYWHMVSKLLLAVQEEAVRARTASFHDQSILKLVEKYHDIRQGLGFCKQPEEFGAFPTDPYSHTPKGQGAKQPGMTGQVKEEILARIAELGLDVREGQLTFDPFLLNLQELLTSPCQFTWLDTIGQSQSLEVPVGALAYTFCQVPILLQKSAQAGIEVYWMDGKIDIIPGLVLDRLNSQHIFQRDGLIHHLRVRFIP
jgi:hypothetical protein